MALDWTLRDTEIGGTVYDFKRFLGRIYASGLYGVPYTINDGVDWTMTNLQPANYYCNKIIMHQGRLFVSGNRRISGNYSSICYYTDDGINWTTKVVSNTASFPTGLDFYSIGSRLFIGHSGNISRYTEGAYYYTDNGGVNWTQVRHPIRSCYAMMEHSGKFYICGQDNVGDQRDLVLYSVNPINPSWVVASTGLSVIDNNNVSSLKEFNEDLYCCDSLGFVYKLITPTSWEMVFSSLEYCYHLEVFYGKLYVCGESATLSEPSVYSTEDGSIWIKEGITSYNTKVYGIWGDLGTYKLWAGTESSRAWVTTDSLEEIGSYSVIEIDALHNVSLSKTVPFNVTALTKIGGFNWNIYDHEWWALPRDVAVSGNHAYVMVALGFIIVNISDKEHPYETGHLHGTDYEDYFSASGGQVKVQGSYAYTVADESDKFTILNVSNEHLPVIVGSLGGSVQYLDAPRGFDIVDNYAFVASYISDALTIVSITNKSNPVRVGQITGSENDLNQARDVAVQENFAYVISTNYLVVIDVTDKENPSYVNSLYELIKLYTPRRIKVQGDYAYIIETNASALIIIDISDHNNLSIVGEIKGAENQMGQVSDLSIAGNYVFITNKTQDNIVVIDVSDKTNPVLDEYTTDLENISGIAVKDGYIYTVHPTPVYGFYIHTTEYLQGSVYGIHTAIEIDELYNTTEMSPLYGAEQTTELLSSKEISELHTTIALPE